MLLAEAFSLKQQLEVLGLTLFQLQLPYHLGKPCANLTFLCPVGKRHGHRRVYPEGRLLGG